MVLAYLVLWADHQPFVASEVERFGARVRAAREAHGWTQEELSARSGLAVVQVSRIERGVREVRLTTILRLVRALELRPDELLLDDVR